MSYSVAKMIEFAFTYVITNELNTKTYDMPEDLRQIIINNMTKRINEIRSQTK